MKFRGVVDGDYTWNEFKSKKQKEGCVVYNLSVEDDESYIVENCIVHNCTDLAVSGARHFAKKREDFRQQDALHFFMQFLEADCDKIAVENPVNIISGEYAQIHFPQICERYNLPIKPSQIIQPYEFGDPYKKTTCLWLKGLPKLNPTNIVEVCDLRTYECKNGKKAVFSYWINKGGKDRQKLRSKTFAGIAKAMANQWSLCLDDKKED